MIGQTFFPSTLNITATDYTLDPLLVLSGCQFFNIGAAQSVNIHLPNLNSTHYNGYGLTFTQMESGKEFVLASADSLITLVQRDGVAFDLAATATGAVGTILTAVWVNDRWIVTLVVGSTD